MLLLGIVCHLLQYVDADVRTKYVPCVRKCKSQLYKPGKKAIIQPDSKGTLVLPEIYLCTSGVIWHLKKKITEFTLNFRYIYWFLMIESSYIDMIFVIHPA